MEAELVARSITLAEGIWLIRLRRDFRHDFTPIPLFTDNQSFIAFTKGDANNVRTKHIDMHYHYMHKQVNAGVINLDYIPTANNPTDILTKPLSPRKHANLLNTLGVCHIWRGVSWNDRVLSHLSLSHQPSLHPHSPPSDPHMAVHISNHRNPESLHMHREIGRINQEYTFSFLFFFFIISFILSFPLHSHPDLICPPIPHADHPRFIQSLIATAPSPLSFFSFLSPIPKHHLPFTSLLSCRPDHLLYTPTIPAPNRV